MLKVNAICAYYIGKKNIIKCNNKNSQDNEKAKKRTDFSGFTFYILHFCLFLWACCCSSCGSSLDEVIKKRGFQRSVMQYSTFDWSSVPLSEEKRLAAENVPVQPRILTVRFR